MTLPEAEHLEALLNTLADHVPIQTTIGNRKKAFYSISDRPDLHPTPSPEECRMYLALVSVCIGPVHSARLPLTSAHTASGRRIRIAG